MLLRALGLAMLAKECCILFCLPMQNHQGGSEAGRRESQAPFRPHQDARALDLGGPNAKRMLEQTREQNRGN